jgi:hypothetical protein
MNCYTVTWFGRSRKLRTLVSTISTPLEGHVRTPVEWPLGFSGPADGVSVGWSNTPWIAASPWIERIAMTAPRAPQWHLTVPLRLAAVALALAGLSFMVEGWLGTLLWVGALVFLVLAAIKFAKVWRVRS